MLLVTSSHVILLRPIQLLGHWVGSSLGFTKTGLDSGFQEEELEDARAATQKKVKALEQQLENEHEERLNFVREKHELETKIINLQELAARSADEEQVTKLKKDLKRTKALLKDAQLMIERSKSDSSNKVVMRQLKNQLEDAEFARTAALKAKQNLELELSDVQQQLDDVMRGKSDLEDRILRMSREKAEMSTQLEDSEEELQVSCRSRTFQNSNQCCSIR